MQNVPNQIAPDGFSNLLAGIDSSKQPSLILNNQAWLATNVDFRSGYAATRPGWNKVELDFQIPSDQITFETGNPQGIGFYQNGKNGRLIVQIDGEQFAIDPTKGFNSINISPAGVMPKNLPKAYMCQWADYFVIQDGESPPVYFNGLTGTRTHGGPKEIPIGTAMAFGWGRGWVSNGQRFWAGDIEGGPTPVVSFTENIYFAEGGSFTLPATMGEINALAFIPLQDTATGQGQLLIGADFGVGSVNGGIPRTQWKNTQIQQVALLDSGWSGQDNRALLNGDIFYRAPDGIRSYRMARAQQGFNGNTPQSNEVRQYLDTDTQKYLKYGSAVYFDGRILSTCSPVFKGTYCYHRGLVVLDSNPQSSIQSKSPPVWDGLWDGLNIVQITKGIFDKEERCFALVRKIDETNFGNVGAVDGLTITVQDTDQFEVGQTFQIQTSGYFKVASIDSGASTITVEVVNQNGSIEVGQKITGGEYNEIWELSKDAPFDTADGEKRLVQSKLWTRSFTHSNPSEWKQIATGMMWIEDVVGTVNWTIKYRPDQFPCMLDWKSGSACSETEVCNEQCPTVLNRHPTYDPAIIFSYPQNVQCSAGTKNASYKGYEFQWLIEWEGHMRIRAVKEICKEEKAPTMGNC